MGSMAGRWYGPVLPRVKSAARLPEPAGDLFLAPHCSSGFSRTTARSSASRARTPTRRR